MADVAVAVFASGEGTNLRALLDADLGPGRVVRVVVNVPEAGALACAREAGVPSSVIDHRVHRPRRVFEEKAIEILRADGVEWVVFAGFMRLVSRTFLDAFEGRVLNLHPSLLPAFPGIDGPRQALDAGVRITGCTVHLVDAGIDSGPIVAQAAVPVFDDDDVASLTARIHDAEHALLPGVVRAVAEGRLVRVDGRPRLDGFPSRPGRLTSPALSEGSP